LDLLLYHYTAHEYLESIMRYGSVAAWDVAITPDDFSHSGVWLTTDGVGHGHGLCASALDKFAVRITVRIPSTDRHLVNWRKWSRKRRIDASWYDTLDRSGGGMADTWWVYFGDIPAERFQSVEVLRESDRPVGSDNAIQQQIDEWLGIIALRDACDAVL
jgi:hypothetical protein